MKVAVILGSVSDKDVAAAAVAALDEFDIAYDVRVLSAHRAPAELAKFVSSQIHDVYIGIAGMAAHLAGAIAANTTKPVIAVPVSGKNLQGLDALLSSVQMPSGVPVATVAIDGGRNAGLLAAQILSVADAGLAEKLLKNKEEMRKRVLESTSEVLAALSV